jgi:hypothetical protein
MLGVGLLCVLASSCARFKAPVAPFESAPMRAGDLATLIEKRQPRVENLMVQMSVKASGGALKGSQLMTLCSFYLHPDRVLLKVDHPRQGEMFRVIQKGKTAAIYMAQEAKFYRGTVEDLDAHPEVLFGMKPTDVVRALLVNQELAASLRAVADNPMPKRDGKHWFVAQDLVDRKELYSVRVKDGLVDKVTVSDRADQPQVIVRYFEYMDFDGKPFPSKFEVELCNSNLTLNVKSVEKLAVGQLKDEQSFQTDPPARIQAKPFEELLKKSAPPADK